MSACAILHVSSLPGGGVDRHIRDIATGEARRHLMWHVAGTADVVEILPAKRFHVLARDAVDAGGEKLRDWLRRQGVGAVHVHSLTRTVRARAEWAAQALGVALIVTLHDVLFMRPEGLDPGASRAPDAAWLGETSAFLGKAAARIVPSGYLAGLAREHLPGQEVAVIPNGVPPPRATGNPVNARPDFEARRPERVAVVLGAIGPHKGAREIEAAAKLLEGSGIAIVIIGYLDAQADPGWRAPALFIHGAYAEQDAAALVRAYRGEVGLFPNRAPESFSYALSELWQAGVPAIVPPEGALAERVRRHGGGWILPEGFGAGEIAAELERIVSRDAAGDLARVKSSLELDDPGRTPSLDAMKRSLELLYERYGLDPASPPEPESRPVQELIAKNLDGALFRVELARACDEQAQIRAAYESEHRANYEAREWILKLDRDIAALTEEVTREVAERRRLGEENAQLAIHKAAFDLLPGFVRKLLLKRIIDGRR